MGFARRAGELLILPLFQRVPFLYDVAAFVADGLGPNGYAALKAQFVRNGRGSRWDERSRRELVARFEHIHEHIPTHSNQADALVFAEALLSTTAEGAMVECGSFAGGSTAKLSVLARLLGRRLLVFDSFEGLPGEAGTATVDYHSRFTSAFTWKAGACRASLEQVQAAVARHGEPSVCTFTKGWFADTLTADHLPAAIGFAYSDVVIPSSARECLRAIWPRLADGAVYFSRDIAFTKVLQALLDERLWRDELREAPPILFGAGFGMRDTSPHLGMMVKGRTLSAAYLDSLNICKVADAEAGASSPRNDGHV